MKRRAIVSVLGAALFAAIAGPLAVSQTAGAQGMKTVRVGMSWIPNVEYGGVWLALEKGYFADEKLDIKYFPGGPNAPKPLVTLSAGKVDIGYGGWLPFLDAVSRGNDFVLVAATFSVSPLGILSLGGNPITKPADIVGKKILAQGAKERKAISATLKLNNLPDKWQAVPAGYSPEPLLNKQGRRLHRLRNQPGGIARAEGPEARQGLPLRIVCRSRLPVLRHHHLHDAGLSGVQPGHGRRFPARARARLDRQRPRSERRRPAGGQEIRWPIWG